MMSFYGVIISIVIALCLIQVAALVSESGYIGSINTAYYQVSHNIIRAMGNLQTRA